VSQEVASSYLGTMNNPVNEKRMVPATAHNKTIASFMPNLVTTPGISHSIMI